MTITDTGHRHGFTTASWACRSRRPSGRSVDASRPSARERSRVRWTERSASVAFGRRGRSPAGGRPMGERARAKHQPPAGGYRQPAGVPDHNEIQIVKMVGGMKKTLTLLATGVTMRISRRLPPCHEQRTGQVGVVDVNVLTTINLTSRSMIMRRHALRQRFWLAGAGKTG